ncbi:OmpA family protein [Algicella marina]|uniref:OmpA family protein n=1 Tax=Algicella marina TaxID=2683284 RepID=A0A6P1T2F7_9RHOB|nr:OmpA family protein [Algicella marina]QHQ35935.1 OmpA family protein [Algicella marina]
MRPVALAFGVLSLLASGWASWLIAGKATDYVERETEGELTAALAEAEIPWASVASDGLLVTLSGEAPSERDRFQAVEAVIAKISSSRLTDETSISTDTPPPAPKLSLQILRAEDATTLLGQVSEGRSYDMLLQALEQRGTVAPPETGMVEILDADAPTGWSESLALAGRAANLLDDAQISLTPGTLNVTAMVDSAEERDRVVELLKATPGYETLNVELVLTAPLPTISPFRFAMETGESSSRVRQCAANTASARQAILAELGDGFGDVDCPIGIGAPTEDWAMVVSEAVRSLQVLGAGSVEIVNTDIALVSAIGGDEAAFRKEAARLDAALPAPYTLNAAYRPAPPEPTEAAEVPPAFFAARRGDDGSVEMRGDLRDSNMQRTAESYAKAQFGFQSVVDQTQLREELPALWYTHILAGLEALSLLSTGEIEIGEDSIDVRGEVSDARFTEEIRTLIARKLPPGTELAIDVTVNPVVRPANVSGARAELCEAQIETILSRAQITFPPGETEFDEDSAAIVDGIARILQECPGSRFEIGGHTDSQGRESSNLAISQARAVTVLNALLDKDVKLVFLIAKGYGETQPIADNDTEEGRAANRRIEFRLVSETPQDEPPVDASEDDDQTPVESEPPPQTNPEPADTDTGGSSGGVPLTDVAPTRSANAPADLSTPQDEETGPRIVLSPPSDDAPSETAESETDATDEDLTPTENALEEAARPLPRTLDDGSAPSEDN